MINQSLTDTNLLQRLIMGIIGEWVKGNKVPISRKIIYSRVIDREGGQIPQTTVKAAVRVLVRKGYLRKAITMERGTSYVQLRTLSFC